jgi:O-antigen ligase/Tfp pilus assembly protein PilF
MEHDEGTVTSTKSQPLLKSAQDIGWLLLVILAPLWVNLWGQQPFELPKAILVRTLVWLLAGLVLAEYVLTGRSLRRELQANPLVGPVGVLALVIVVTTVTAVDWRLSLWGSYERGQGAVTLLTYLLLFLLVADQLRSFSRARQLMTAMVAAGVPLILFSLLQTMGWNPFGLVSDARSPIYATLGRANFVSAYLAILGPLTLALLLTTRQRGLRVLWSAVLVSEIVVIGLTSARSAWLAMAVSLSLFSLLWWGPQLARCWRRLAWIGVGLLFLSGPLAVLWLGQRQLGSTSARLTIWQGTVELIRQRPLLGYGADALEVVFPRVYPSELVYYQGRDFFVDRAHNLLLDWTVMAGIPGLLAFFLVLIMVVIVVGRALDRPQRPEKPALLIAILAAVLGNTANNLVSFDVTPTATASWLLMGMGVALAAPSTCQASATVGKQRFWQWALVGLLFGIIGTVVWQINGRPLLADIAARSAHRYAQAGDWARAIAAGERAVTHWPVEPAHHLLLSQTYWQQAVTDPATAPIWLPPAETALLTARQIRPTDPVMWLHAANFYTAAAGQFGSATHDLADDAYRQALTLAPHHATIYTAWGRALLENGDSERAAVLLREAVALDASNGEAYLYLGAAELALGRLEIALADYQEAVRLLPESSQAYAGLANSYWHLDRPQEALLAVEKALQRDPQNVQATSIRQEIYDSP